MKRIANSLPRLRWSHYPVLLFSLCLLAAMTARAATVTVLNTADSGPGSLRQALADVQDGDTINFNLPTTDPGYDAAAGRWTISVTSAEPDYDSDETKGALRIRKSVIIAGPGADKLTILHAILIPSYLPRYPTIGVLPGRDVVISGITLTRTNPAPYNNNYHEFPSLLLNNSATLRLSGCAVVNCANPDGGVKNDGGTVLNRAQSGDALLIVEHCRFANNSAHHSASSLGNSADPGHSATLRVSHSSFTGDSSALAVISSGANGSTGGAKVLEVEDSVFQGSAEGAIFASSVDLLIKNTTISEHTSSDYPAVTAVGGRARIFGSTLSNNSSGGLSGGLDFESGDLEITNSTFSNNQSTRGGSGGALYLQSASVVIGNSTFVGNKSPEGFGIAGNSGYPFSLAVSNSIFKSSAGGSNINPGSSTVTSHGYNISNDNFAGFLTATGDQPNTEPLLGDLAPNGGPTNTHAPSPSSPAIDRGDPAFNPASFTPARDLDQRGYFRVINGRIDIGAVETGSRRQKPPVANAGSDQSVNEQQLVSLDGSLSSDPDGSTLTYAWSQISGGAAVSLANANTAHPSFTAPSVAPGGETLSFQLAVTAEGTTAVDSVNVSVVNVNHPPVADAGRDQSVAEGSPVTLHGEPSFDIDNDSFTYTWVQVNNGAPAVTLSSANSASPTFTAPYVGTNGAPGVVATLVFELRVDDGYPADAPAPGFTFANSVDQVKIDITNVNNKPIAAAGPDQTVDENTAAALNGSASSDPDGDSLTYSWAQTGGPSVTLAGATTATPSFTAPTVSSGGADVQFDLTVNDGYGGAATDRVVIHVRNIGAPPLITAAQPTASVLWPPNHGLIAVGIIGVSNSTSIKITAVTQDEPTNGLGDGDTAIDAIINADGTVLLRAERSGKGDGRVYRVYFTASNLDGSASGMVKVSVPKNKKADAAIDSGTIYNSTR